MESTVTRALKIVLALVVLIALGWILVSISSTITILIVSFLLAYILDPLVSVFEYKGLSRTQATIVVYVMLGLLVVAIFSFLIPPLVNELRTIEEGIRSGKGTDFFNNVEDWIRRQLPFINVEQLDLKGKVDHFISGLTSSVFSIIGSMVSIVTTLIIIPFATFFFLKDGRHIKKSLISMIPNRYFEMTLNLLYKTDQQLGGYLRGQFFDAMIIGILAIIALWILKVPYFILIGVFAGLTNMIPYVGPLTGAVTAIIVVLITGGGSHQIVFVAIAFAIIQLLDNVLVQPLVVAKTVNLHPLLIIFAVIIGGQFFGILGMILAVPVTGMIKVLVNEFYISIRKYQII